MRGKKRPASERMRALGLAAVDGAAAASERTGIPESTIRLWMDKPEYAELQAKTGEQLATGFLALAHLAMGGLMDAIKAQTVDPRDLAIALGVATDKHLLMSGAATARSEVSTFNGRNDHETEAIAELLREALAGDGEPASSEGVPGDVAVEVSGSPSATPT